MSICDFVIYMYFLWPVAQFTCKYVNTDVGWTHIHNLSYVKYTHQLSWSWSTNNIYPGLFSVLKEGRNKFRSWSQHHYKKLLSCLLQPWFSWQCWRGFKQDSSLTDGLIFEDLFPVEVTRPVADCPQTSGASWCRWVNGACIEM